MPLFIIPTGGGKAKKWKIAPGSTVIGRVAQAGLRLPNVSVSRRHAMVRLRMEDVLQNDENGEKMVRKATVSVEDLDSSNGIHVNNAKVECANLQPGDVVRIGKFHMSLVEDAERFWKGRTIAYMPDWDGSLSDAQASTFQMDRAEMKRLMMAQHTVDHARLVLAKNQTRFWHPEEGPLTFGGDAMVHVDGLSARGTAAEVTWDGSHHVIAKKGMLAKITVNGQSVSNQRLAPGDAVAICGTHFVYSVS
jgi:hypothetical protein